MILTQTGVISTRATVVDQFGGKVLTFTPGASIRCTVEPATEQIIQYAGRFGLDATHVGFAAQGTVLDTTMRLTIGSNVYDIIKVQGWRIGSSLSNHVEFLLGQNTSPETT